MIPGGRDVAVTNTSVVSYIHRMAHFKLNVQTARPCKAFLQGFRYYFDFPFCFVRVLWLLRACAAPHGARGIHDTASSSSCSNPEAAANLPAVVMDEVRKLSPAAFFSSERLRPYASHHVPPSFSRALLRNRDLIPVEWIRLFNPQELQRLIGGEGGRAIDVDDLKRNTLYSGGYHESQPVMKVPSRHPVQSCLCSCYLVRI